MQRDYCRHEKESPVRATAYRISTTLFVPVSQSHDLVILTTIFSSLGSKRDAAKQNNNDAKETDHRDVEVKDERIESLSQVADL